MFDTWSQDVTSLLPLCVGGCLAAGSVAETWLLRNLFVREGSDVLCGGWLFGKSLWLHQAFMCWLCSERLLEHF